MRKSYSKIRHIQESNMLLEKRRFNIIKEFYEPIDDLENEDEDKDFISDFDDDVDLVVGI
jgi:hypothetical protein